MAQVDKLLQQIVMRGARSLRIEPNQPPYVEFPGGGSAPLLAQALPATMLDHLTQEVIPSHAMNAWAQSGQVVFEHKVDGTNFRVAIERTAIGNRFRAEPLDTLSGVVFAEPEAELIEMDTHHAAIRTPEPPRPPVQAPPLASAATVAHLGSDTPAAVAVSEPSFTPSGPKEMHPLALQLFTTLLQRKGSDIHCSSYEVPIFRVDGELEDYAEVGLLGEAQLLEIMESLATPDAWGKFKATNDADFAYEFKQGGCRLRVNYFQDRVGPAFVARVIPNEIPDPDRLGLPEPIRQLALLAKGLVLVTGPTGSGKSTTLAAIIDLANRQRMDHILTIEDPIEFVHPRKKCLINQREVHTHTESFKSGLRAALREDPDIILVGEMRDLETIAIALETAVTGHLVFGTLHTSSAVGTIDRIVDQFPADRQQQIRVMMADSLKAVISQILLKKIGGGRVAALESLFITPAISNLMREGKIFQIPSAMQVGRSYGQRLMNDVLMDMIQAKQITAMDAYMKCPDKESFIQTLKRAGINFDPRAGLTDI